MLICSKTFDNAIDQYKLNLELAKLITKWDIGNYDD